MLKHEDNERLTRVGKGTPGGELNLITNEVSQRAVQPMVHVPVK